MRIKQGLTAMLLAGALALGSSPSHALSNDGLSRVIELHNKTGTTIYTVEWTNSSARTYDGIDVLGDSIIRPDEVFTSIIDDDSGACVFDIKVTYRNDATQQIRVDVCKYRHIDALSTGLVVAY